MIKPRHTWPLVTAATLTCAACEASHPRLRRQPVGPSTPRVQPTKFVAERSWRHSRSAPKPSTSIWPHSKRLDHEC